MRIALSCLLKPIIAFFLAVVVYKQVTERFYPISSYFQMEHMIVENPYVPQIEKTTKKDRDATNSPAAEQTPAIVKLLEAADDGGGYHFPDKNILYEKPWVVTLFGKQWETGVRRISGCPIGDGVCPMFPNCTIRRELSEIPPVSDVIIMQTYLLMNNRYLIDDYDTFMAEYNSTASNQSKRVYSVLYWREAISTWHVPYYIQKRFDVTMGYHYRSHINNPLFLLPPSLLINNIEKNGTRVPASIEDRPLFAVSFISDCGASSLRDDYIYRMVRRLGEEKIHRYGACGDGHKLSKDQFWSNEEYLKQIINHSAYIKTIAKYKFYLAFENTIKDGYVTEKLFSILSMGIVPVYYGHPKVLKITTSPSYVNASNFRSPEALSDYLLYLSENNTAYMEYHAWRKDPSLFTREYLDYASKNVPGSRETSEIQKRLQEPYWGDSTENPEVPSPGIIRKRAICCRLCNKDYVEILSKLEKVRYQNSWSDTRINHEFFSGSLKLNKG